MNAKDNNWNDANLTATRRRRLAAEVLRQAAHDLRRFHGSRSTTGRELYLDAYAWITTDEFSWPFSFLNVCRALNLVPEIVREELMSDSSLGTLDYWMRRCGRARRRVRELFQQLVVTDYSDEATDRPLAAQPSTTVI